MPGGLELRRDDLTAHARRDGEAHQRGRHVEVFKGAAHGVLAADCGYAEVLLCFERTEQCAHWLAPAFAVMAGLLKVFLERQVYMFKVCAGGDQLTDGFHNGKISAVVGALFGNKGVVSPAH